MVEYDPEKRLSLGQIENDPWYLSDDIPSEDDILKLAEELREMRQSYENIDEWI